VCRVERAGSVSPTQRVWLPPHPAIAGHTPVLLFELAATVRNAVDDALRREDCLPWNAFLVLAVADQIRDGSQEAICDRVRMDRGSLSRLVADLEADGYVDRAPDWADRRKLLCRPTPTGARAAADAAIAVDEASRKALRRLRASERARLQVLLARSLGATPE
jgi:MarR family transcriptional regulator, lower aerobic nicotinate degradation pathway regulator